MRLVIQPICSRSAARDWFGDWCATYRLREDIRRGFAETELADRRATIVKESLDLFDAFVAHKVEPFVGLWAKADAHKSNLVTAEVDRLAASSKEAIDSVAVHFDARLIWESLYLVHPAFVLCVSALLSGHASEAAVERAFSAQGKTHSAVRNSLKPASVENEMFLKFNMRSFKRGELVKLDHHQCFGAVIELELEHSEDAELTDDIFNEQVANLQQGSQSTDQLANQATTQSTNQTTNQPADRNYEWIIDQRPDRRALAVDWLETEFGKRAVTQSGRLRFNDVIENDLIQFATSRGSGDHLTDLKRELRLYIAEQRQASLHCEI